MPPVINKPNPEVYINQACAVMRTAIELLSRPGVEKSGDLEELVIAAPRWGELESYFQRKPRFALEVDLPAVLKKIDGQQGISPERGLELLTKFRDYQWSRTPDVWNSYFQARKIASYRSNDLHTYGDPTDVIAALQSSLGKLVDQRSIRDVEASIPLRAHREQLGGLRERCAALPAEMNFWEACVSLINWRSPASLRADQRSAAIKDINAELKRLVTSLQPDLIAFGKEYRARYLAEIAS